MKNIIRGIMLSGPFIVIPPLILIACTYIVTDLFFGFDASFGIDISVMAFLFSVPVGIVITIFGIVLELIFSRLYPSYSKAPSNRIVTMSVALSFATCITLYLLLDLF